jgi:7-carboxy-7-deazaguanine synthase
MIDNTYPVHERFATWQGEGVFMGTPAFFIRLFGCPVHCPWCDSAGTWHPKYIPTDVPRVSPQELVQEALRSEMTTIVLTGGEPAVHNLDPLCTALHEAGFRVHIETSGAFPVRGRVDWMTLSPKRWKMPIGENIQRADEFKFIIEGPEDIPFYYNALISLGFSPKLQVLGSDEPLVPIWLHPEWSQHNNPAVLNLISSQVKHGKGVFRAGWQLHKNYLVDSLDSRTRPLVPLGGDPARGL